MDANKEVPVDAVYAGELRAEGCDIPANIPDCAWVPRHGVKYRPAFTEFDGFTLTLKTSISFTEPFTWVEVPVRVTPHVTLDPNTFEVIPLENKDDNRDSCGQPHR